jgi:microcystin-dependent protein
MSYIQLPTRTSADPNSAADVNQLQANIEALKGGTGSTAPTTTVEALSTNKISTSVLSADNTVLGRVSSTISGLTASDLINILGLVGTIHPFAGTDANKPANTLICDGAAISRAIYSRLYAIIGTTWGAGDSSTTFNLPDLRAATLRGVGTDTAFTEHATITLAQTIDDKIQGHRHNFRNDSTSLDVATFGVGQSAGSSAGLVSFNGTTNTFVLNIGSPKTDGTNGTPRTGTETTGKARGVNFVIFY